MSTTTVAPKHEQNCPECGSQITHDERRAEQVCTACGLVIDEEQVDHGPEWRNFESGEDRSRVGAPRDPTRHDNGLSTTLGTPGSSGWAPGMSAERQRQFSRMQKQHRRAQTASSQDKSIRDGSLEIERIRSALGLPENVEETAAMLFKRATKDGVLYGWSIERMAAACVIGATRMAEIPLPMVKVVEVTQESKHSIRGPLQDLHDEYDVQSRLPEPREYLPRIASDVTGGDNLLETARKLLDNAKDADVTSVYGKDPVCVVAGALYAAGRIQGEGPDQQEIASAAQVCVKSVRTHYKNLLQVTGQEHLIT